MDWSNFINYTQFVSSFDAFLYPPNFGSQWLTDSVLLSLYQWLTCTHLLFNMLPMRRTTYQLFAKKELKMHRIRSEQHSFM